MIDAAIRTERPQDADDVGDLNEQAFGGPVEARLVEALRGSPGLLSLVATVEGRVVGHILFTPVSIDPAPVRPVRVAGLAPMAVRPEFQRSGIGGQLVRAGLDECRRHGYAAVVVVGHPEYYRRFGFVPAHTRGLEYEGDVPREVFMAVELELGALTACSGVVRYRREFADAG